MKHKGNSFEERNQAAPLEIPYPAEPRHAGQPWTRAHSARHSIKDWGPSLTKQSEAASCDINNIIATQGIVPPEVAQTFGDFDLKESFLEAQTIIANANAQFKALDATLRKRFDNDPAEFLDFVHNPENAEEMVKMGILERIVAPDGPVAPLAPDSSASNEKKVAPPKGGAKAAKTAGEAV